MPLALQLALRFLDEGRSQTLLILAGVTVGVAAYVFITATMQGVQANLIDKTLGSQAHVTITVEEPPPRPILQPAEGETILRTVGRPEPRQTPFDQWKRALSRVEATPGIVAVCPKITGPALALRGGAQQAIEIIGADPARLARIVDLPGNLIRGEYRATADQVVVGSELASELGLEIGRPFLIRTDGGERTMRVAGVFELGNSGVDGRWVVTSLRAGQSLLGAPGDITAIDATVVDVFGADEVAARVAARTNLKAESWQSRNAALLTGLSAQNQSTRLIQVFTLLAVAMGIASVLAVTVVQRRGQIGILRAMGMGRFTILRLFLWQGALLGMGGAVLGTVVGGIAGASLGRVVPFDIVVDWQTAIFATLISVCTGLAAALWPARSAAAMDPAAAIRGDG